MMSKLPYLGALDGAGAEDGRVDDIGVVLVSRLAHQELFEPAVVARLRGKRLKVKAKVSQSWNRRVFGRAVL